MANLNAQKKKKAILALVKHLCLIAFAVGMLYPVIWMFLSSFQKNDEIFNVAAIFPRRWMFENYVNGWKSVPDHTFGTFFRNSFFLSFSIVAGTVISASLTAYPFARLKFRGQKILFSLVIATLLLPGQILLIPRYLLFVKFGWGDSYLPMNVPAFFAQAHGAFSIYLLIQFMRGIPKELDEAALVDGCGYFAQFFRIIIPNCKPALFTVGIFSFIWSWDDFLNHLIYLNSIGKFTVSLALRMFTDNSAQIPWGQMFAMSILSIAPCAAIFACAQRYFVEGIATTGLK
ncbi:MAG: carbohydrate ABC transporter permease [Spirochaetaceae bacterium]|jgi:ABC-type glycerol-3-phosphate transport system permease component|nr:carbohydrate ABC transporter permease [Spirochaetaceae bacterium]